MDAGGTTTIPGDGLPAGTSAAAIAHELKEAIVGGRYAAGQRLPPERRLATHFSTSRGTVREALRQLTQQHLVERRIGSGTFITYRQAVEEHEIAEETSPLQLIEVRMAVEPQMARLAVLHASNRDLERLAAALAALRRCHDAPERYSAADEQFHLALAACTGNPLMVWLYRQINEVRLHAQWAAMRGKVLTPENMRLYDDQHAAVFEAVRRRDADAAAAAMAEQMAKARADLLGAQSR
jgi:DNA-binding FadR family transcriptional regulator